MEIKREVFWCDCGEHMLSVEKEEWNDSIETYIMLWRLKGLDKYNSPWHRVKTAFAALRGELFHDGVCLQPDEVRHLIEVLQKEIR